MGTAYTKTDKLVRRREPELAVEVALFWIEISLMVVVSIRFVHGASRLRSFLDADDRFPEGKPTQETFGSGGQTSALADLQGICSGTPACLVVDDDCPCLSNTPSNSQQRG
jgi:hypothetical protein